MKKYFNIATQAAREQRKFWIQNPKKIRLISMENPLDRKKDQYVNQAIISKHIKASKRVL